MSKNEQQAYEARLKNDPEFARRVAVTLQTIDSVGRAEIRTRVDENFDLLASENSRRNKTRRQIAIAAAVLLLGSFSFFFFQDLKPDLKEIYAEYYEFQQVGSRETPPASDSIWTRTLHTYSQQSRAGFQTTVEQLNQLLKQADFRSGHGNEAYLYLGISYLELGEPQKAITAFENVSKNAPGYAGDATWYAALTWLQLEDKAAAIHAFTALKADPRWSTARRKKAAEICELLGCPAVPEPQKHD